MVITDILRTATSRCAFGFFTSGILSLVYIIGVCSVLTLPCFLQYKPISCQLSSQVQGRTLHIHSGFWITEIDKEDLYRQIALCAPRSMYYKYRNLGISNVCKTESNRLSQHARV